MTLLFKINQSPCLGMDYYFFRRGGEDNFQKNNIAAQQNC